MTRVPGPGRAARALRAATRVMMRAARRRSRRGVILLYHRVAGPRFDPLLLDVRPDRFDAHLAVLRRTAEVLSLAEFEAHRRGGTLPSRAVAVTFDDGYADNLRLAAPLLSRHQVPATIFVVSGMVGATGEFWWDDAERVAFSPAVLAPPAPIAGLAWNSAGPGLAAPGPDDATPGDWNVEMPLTPTRRHALYRALVTAVRTMPLAERTAAMGALRRWSGVDDAARPSHRALTVAELVTLAARPGISIGAHTVTHPVMALQGADAQQREAEASRDALEFAIGCPVTTFAYPFGTRADVTRVSMRAVRAAGYDAAFANEPATAWRWSTRWRVPRMLVRDWPPDEFARRLATWWEY